MASPDDLDERQDQLIARLIDINFVIRVEQSTVKPSPIISPRVFTLKVNNLKG